MIIIMVARKALDFLITAISTINLIMMVMTIRSASCDAVDYSDGDRDEASSRKQTSNSTPLAPKPYSKSHNSPYSSLFVIGLVTLSPKP